MTVFLGVTLSPTPPTSHSTGSTQYCLNSRYDLAQPSYNSCILATHAPFYGNYNKQCPIDTTSFRVDLPQYCISINVWPPQQLLWLHTSWLGISDMYIGLPQRLYENIQSTTVSFLTESSFNFRIWGHTNCLFVRVLTLSANASTDSPRFCCIIDSCWK